MSKLRHKFFDAEDKNVNAPSWYVDTTREKVEDFLRNNQSLSVVIRPNSERNGYALSAINKSGKIAHYAIKITHNGRYQLLLDNEPPSESCLYNILRFYRNYKRDSLKRESTHSHESRIRLTHSPSKEEYIDPNPGPQLKQKDSDYVNVNNKPYDYVATDQRKIQDEDYKCSYLPMDIIRKNS